MFLFILKSVKPGLNKSVSTSHIIGDVGLLLIRSSKRVFLSKSQVRDSQCSWKHENHTSHIRLLLLSFFFEFYPQLIRDGKIYSLQTPLYIIKKGKEFEYIFTETEMAKVLPTLPKSATYARMKGLGELSPEILAKFSFSNSRELIQFTMEDEEVVAQLLENFMGVDGEERREFVS